MGSIIKKSFATPMGMHFVVKIHKLSNYMQIMPFYFSYSEWEIYRMDGMDAL